MRKLLIILTVISLGGVTAARAQAATDLFIGFNDASGPDAAQNDYVIDIGAYGALTNSAGTNGGTIDLMSAGAPIPIDSSAFTSNFTLAFSTDSSALNEVAAGVVGGQTGTNPKLFWQTVPTSVGTPHTISGSQLRTAANQPQALAAGEYVSTTQDTGWTWLVAASTGLPGTEPSGSVASSTGVNPLDQLTSGTLILNLWANSTASSVSSTTSGWVQKGYFTFNLNTYDITFTLGASAPPPPPPPTIASVFQSGGNLIFSGGNGQANTQYRILSATNLSIPSTNWTPVLTNTFSAGGTYSVTNSTGTSPAAYFRIVTP